MVESNLDRGLLCNMEQDKEQEDDFDLFGGGNVDSNDGDTAIDTVAIVDNSSNNRSSSIVAIVSAPSLDSNSQNNSSSNSSISSSIVNIHSAIPTNNNSSSSSSSSSSNVTIGSDSTSNGNNGNNSISCSGTLSNLVASLDDNYQIRTPLDFKKKRVTLSGILNRKGQGYETLLEKCPYLLYCPFEENIQDTTHKKSTKKSSDTRMKYRDIDSRRNAQATVNIQHLLCHLSGFPKSDASRLARVRASNSNESLQLKIQRKQKKPGFCIVCKNKKQNTDNQNICTTGLCKETYRGMTAASKKLARDSYTTNANLTNTVAAQTKTIQKSSKVTKAKSKEMGAMYAFVNRGKTPNKK